MDAKTLSFPPAEVTRGVGRRVGRISLRRDGWGVAIVGRADYDSRPRRWGVRSLVRAMGRPPQRHRGRGEVAGVIEVARSHKARTEAAAWRKRANWRCNRQSLSAQTERMIAFDSLEAGTGNEHLPLRHESRRDFCRGGGLWRGRTTSNQHKSGLCGRQRGGSFAVGFQE